MLESIIGQYFYITPNNLHKMVDAMSWWPHNGLIETTTTQGDS